MNDIIHKFCLEDLCLLHYSIFPITVGHGTFYFRLALIIIYLLASVLLLK